MQQVHTYADQEKIFPCTAQRKVDGIRVICEHANGKWLCYTRSGADATEFMQIICLSIEESLGLEDGDNFNVRIDGELQHRDGFRATLSHFKLHNNAGMIYYPFQSDCYLRETGCVKPLLGTPVANSEQAKALAAVMQHDDFCDGIVLVSAYGLYRVKQYRTVSGVIAAFSYTGWATVKLGESDGGEMVNCRAKVVQDRLKIGQKVELQLKRNTWVYLRRI